MSEQDSAAVVRRAYEAFQRGDIQTVLDLLTDDVEWHTPEVAGAPYGGLRRGKAEVARFFQLLDEAEEVLAFEPGDFIAQGGRVAVTGRYRARVRAGGKVIDVPWAQIFTVLNGKVSRFQELTDTAAIERAFRQSSAA